MDQLDELERHLDDKPQRVLRSRLSKLDYSNSQSPHPRRGHHGRKGGQTPRARSQSIENNSSRGHNMDLYDSQDLDDTPGDVAKDEAERPGLFEWLKDLNLVALFIDGISCILSVILVSLWGVTQLYEFVKSGNAAKWIKSFLISAKSSLYFSYSLACELLVKLRGKASIYSSVIYQLISTRSFDFYVFLKASTQTSFAILISHLPQFPTAITTTGTAFLAYLKKPIVKYRIKTFLMISSLVLLCSVIVMSHRAAYKTSMTDAKQFLPKTSCGEQECLVDVNALSDLKNLQSKTMENLHADEKEISNLKATVKDLYSRIESFEMQLDMKEEMLEQSLDKVKSDIFQSLDARDAFQYGPDYSLASTGAYIDMDHTSSSYYTQTIIGDLLNINSQTGPQQVLDPSTTPGNCWGMKGSFGFVEMVLPRVIKPKALVVTHANPQSLFIGAIKSAPKTIQVYSRMNGFLDVLLGTINFSPLESSTFILPLENDGDPIDRLLWKIKDNWGNPDWTCIYRLAVHGEEK